MKVIVYTRPDDGGLSVVAPIPNARLIWSQPEGQEPVAVPAFEMPGFRDVAQFLAAADGVGPEAFAETEDAFLARIMARSVPPDAINPTIIDDASLPSKDAFRNAWSRAGKKVIVDMPKARDIHRARLRDARKPLLEALDVEYQRADERGDDAAKKDVAARKQALRDVTKDPRIDAARTVADLATVEVK